MNKNQDENLDIDMNINNEEYDDNNDIDTNMVINENEDDKEKTESTSISKVNKSNIEEKKKKSYKTNTHTSSNKRKFDEEVPLRKSTRKKIPPCKYWEGERPEDLLDLDEEQIKARKNSSAITDEIIKRQGRRKTVKRNNRKVKKENEDEGGSLRKKVKMIDASTETLPLNNINSIEEEEEADFGESLKNTRLQSEIRCYDIKTKGETNKKLVMRHGMIVPQTVHNNSYKFTKIFSEDNQCATGLLLFPKHSDKPGRSSKNNFLIFFVITGKLEIQIHETKVMVYAGDHFVIPKGNQYSIKNDTEKESKVWFVQCKIKE